MIISHKHKFIFIHIPKCAGSTTSWTLLNTLYSDMISSKPPGPGFNQIDPKIAEIFRCDGFGNSTALLQHDHIGKVKKYFIEKNLNLNDYFKFTFMRNPWARRVSQWEYARKIIRGNPDPSPHAIRVSAMSFDEYIASANDVQLNWITGHNDDKISVDYIGSGINIQQDYDTVCDKIGVPTRQLAVRNKTEHKHYTDYYSNELRQIVAEKCKADIELFGYKFEE